MSSSAATATCHLANGRLSSRPACHLIRSQRDIVDSFFSPVPLGSSCGALVRKLEDQAAKHLSVNDVANPIEAFASMWGSFTNRKFLRQKSEFPL